MPVIRKLNKRQLAKLKEQLAEIERKARAPKPRAPRQSTLRHVVVAKELAKRCGDLVGDWYYIGTGGNMDPNRKEHRSGLDVVRDRLYQELRAEYDEKPMFCTRVVNYAMKHLLHL